MASGTIKTLLTKEFNSVRNRGGVFLVQFPLGIKSGLGREGEDDVFKFGAGKLLFLNGFLKFGEGTDHFTLGGVGFLIASNVGGIAKELFTGEAVGMQEFL